MTTQSRFAFVLCLLSLFYSTMALGWAQNKSLDDVKTRMDVYAYIRQEFDKLVWVDAEQHAVSWFEIHNAAGKKLVEISQHDSEKEEGYRLQLSAHQHLVKMRIEGAEQKMEAFLDELASKEESKSLAEKIRFEAFTGRAENVARTPESFAAFKTELKQWLNKRDYTHEVVWRGMKVALRTGQNLEQFAEELVEYVLSEQCTLPAIEKEKTVARIHEVTPRYKFYEFTGKVLNNTERTPENFAVFKAELKQWMDRVERVDPMNNGMSIEEVMNLGLAIAERHHVSAEQFVAEFVEYVSSESPLPETVKADIIAAWEKALRTALGSNSKLFGTMVDGKEFDWESLRGKYVLVDFAHQHHDFNKQDMWEAYKNYHDKGLVIVSVYFRTYGEDPIADVKQYVEKEQIPWMVISDALTTLGKQTLWQWLTEPLLGKANRGNWEGELETHYYFSRNASPTILVDREGKIIMVHARGDRLKTKLAEIFE